MCDIQCSCCLQSSFTNGVVTKGPKQQAQAVWLLETARQSNLVRPKNGLAQQITALEEIILSRMGK
jgi:hypothetical protein